MTLEIVSTTEQRIRELVDEFKLAFQRTLELAVQLGEALEEHKGKLPHGAWLPWLESNFELGDRMAERFMLLARNSTRVSNLPPDTSIRAAVKWLQEQDREPRPLPQARDFEPEPLLRFCQDLDTATIVTLILRVAFPDAETALDLTYGSGAFWDGTAHVRVTAHDVDPARAPGGAVDFTAVPYGDASYDVVVLDPPHLADAGEDSIMGHRFGTYDQFDLEDVVRRGVCEAWRVAKLGMVIKITDHVHGQRYVAESDWVRQALDGGTPYEVVYQVRSDALIDPRWQEQASAYNNGSTYLVFRKGDQRHVRR